MTLSHEPREAVTPASGSRNHPEGGPAAAPVVSIVTPTRNAARTLNRALMSLRGQCLVDWEWWILDAVSDDGTREMAEGAAADDPRIHVRSARDAGIYDAMNKGIRLATGKWIYFLGADDELFDAHVLSGMLAGQDADCDILYGDVLRVPRQDIYDGPFDLGKLLTRNICHQAMFYRRDLFDRIGGFDLRFPILADWHFNLRCMLDPSVRFRYTNKIVARFQLGGTSSKPEPGWHEERIAMLGRRLGLGIEDQALLQSVLDNLVRRTVEAEESLGNLEKRHAGLERIYADLTRSRTYRLAGMFLWPLNSIRSLFSKRGRG